MSGSEQQHTTTDILPLVRTPVGPLVVDAVLDLLTGSETRRAHLCAPAAHDGAGQHRLGRGSKRRRRRRALLLLLALCSLFYLLARLRRGASAGTGTGDTARGSRGDDAFGNERRAGDSSSRTAEGQRRRITGTGQTAAQEANYVRLRDLIDSKRSAFDDLRLFLGGERLALDVDALELEDGEGEGASGEMNDDEDDEAEEASGARGVRRAPSARSAPPPGLLPPVTAVVLHFARPRALSLVLRHLSRHAFIREIIVWNNDPFASSNALNFTAPPPREAREAQEDEEQALEGGGLDVLDVEQALAPGSDTGREPPPPLVRVLNAPANVRDLGKYHACALAQHAHCFFADDDWLNLQLDAAYTKYVDCCAGAAGVVVDAAGQGGNAQEGGGPGDEEGLRGIISASTLPIIHLQHQLWRFDNPSASLARSQRAHLTNSPQSTRRDRLAHRLHVARHWRVRTSRLGPSLPLTALRRALASTNHHHRRAQGGRVDAAEQAGAAGLRRALPALGQLVPGANGRAARPDRRRERAVKVGRQGKRRAMGHGL